VALVRENTDTGDWKFVQWINGENDWVIDVPGPGNWFYALAVVIGSGSPATSITYEGLVQLSLDHAKK
jgi:hypothetical protein